MSRESITHAEAIIKWLQTPKEDRAPLPPKQMEILKRWSHADDLLREHLSPRKVIPMLTEKYGYSKRSAERDIEGAMRSWAWRPKHDKLYLAEILWDFLMETMVRAAKDRKFGDVARLAREAVNAMGLHKKDDAGDGSGTKVIVVQPMHDPQLLGVAPMPAKTLQELTEQLLREKVTQGFIEQSTVVNIADAADRGD